MSQGFTKGIPISTDGTLSTNSDNLIPSEKAVKTYVDSSSLPDVYSVASIATLTPDISTYDSFEVTAQAAAILIANPTGSIENFEGFIIRLTDNGTSRAISYGAKYRAFGSALPTATTIGKTIYLICIYNSTDDVYDTASREEV